MREYERVNQAIAALEFQGDGSAEFVGQRSLFDLNKTILNSNLYGIDLSPESVEITKLSLWVKTAEAGQTLTYLDDNIKVGNSIVDDSSVAKRAFNWQAEFSDVFATGGFDVVIGNPPYVRQELLLPIKPYLQTHYESYDGVADLYTYFYEKGMWYYLYRVTIHGANETLRLKNIYTETLPIASPTDEIRAEVEPIVSRLIEITKAN